jgi:hypothetical protein
MVVNVFLKQYFIEMWKINEKGLVCCNTLLKNKIEKQIFEFFWPHLDSNFSLVAQVFRLFFLLLKQVLKTCCHLMWHSLVEC